MVEPMHVDGRLRIDISSRGPEEERGPGGRSVRPRESLSRCAAGLCLARPDIHPSPGDGRRSLAAGAWHRRDIPLCVRRRAGEGRGERDLTCAALITTIGHACNDKMIA